MFHGRAEELASGGGAAGSVEELELGLGHEDRHAVRSRSLDLAAGRSALRPSHSALAGPAGGVWRVAVGPPVRPARFVEALQIGLELARGLAKDVREDRAQQGLEASCHDVRFVGDAPADHGAAVGALAEAVVLGETPGQWQRERDDIEAHADPAVPYGEVLEQA